MRPRYVLLAGLVLAGGCEHRTALPDAGLDAAPPRRDAGSPPRQDASALCGEATVPPVAAISGVDAVILVDSSGSMEEEAELVRANINQLAMEVSDSGVDFHIIMIADSEFVTAPDPLGSDAEHSSTSRRRSAPRTRLT